MSPSEEKKQQFSSQLQPCTKGLYQLALRLTQNEADAEDLVADTVIKAWNAFDKLNENSRFRSWIFRILHNRFVSNYRKKVIRPHETVYDEQESDQEDGHEVIGLLLDQSDDFLMWWANPEKTLAKRLLKEDIHNAIDELPEVFRIAIQLVNVEGFSYDEAAEMLNVPPGTVRSRMKRGRTLLQKQLWQHAKEAGLLIPQIAKEGAV